MKPLVAPHIAALKPDAPGRSPKLVAQELGVSRVLPLGSNENPLGPSPHVLRALELALSQVHRYPDSSVHALRDRLARHYEVPATDLALGHGSNSLIELIARTFATSAEHAVIGAPSFTCYMASLAAANVPTSVVPLRDALYWDLAAVRAAVRPETKLVFLDNPGNPVSTHIPRDELREFLRELPEDIVVVVDEAYAEFADAPSFASALSMRGSRERLIVLRTFSKAYALAGLRVGYAIAPAALIRPMEAMRVPFTVSNLAQLAAEAALSDVEHLQRTLAHNAQERRRMSETLRRAGLALPDSQTNFLLVALGRAGAPIHQALLQHGVLVRLPGPKLPQHLRISIGTAEDNDILLGALFEVLHARRI